MIIYGTRTLGKENHKKRYKKCPHCGKFTKVNSYTARKWFTLYFIPLIPFAKKRIQDECPSCSMGYHHEHDKWEAAKTANIQKLSNGSFDIAKPEEAVSIHQIAELYGTDDQANSIAEKIEAQHGADPGMQEYLASWHFSIGKFDKAIPKMEQLSEAGFHHLNMNIARYYSTQGDMDTTIKYLLKADNFENEHDFNIYQKVIGSLKSQNRKDDAYKLYQFVSKFPVMQNMLTKRKFRKDIERLEKELSVSESILKS